MKKKREMSPLRMYILLITYAILLVMFFIYKSEIFDGLKLVLNCIRPFFIGILIAYILNNPLRFLENRVFPWLLRKKKKRNPHVERAVATGLTVLFAVAVVTAIVAVLIPQLTESVTLFISNVDTYINTLESFTSSLNERFHLKDELWLEINSIASTMLDEAANTLKGSAPTIINKTKDVMTAVVNGLFNTLMSLIISIYMLYHREKLLYQLNKILRAFLPENIYAYLMENCAYANLTFTRFLGGQITEACILSILCFVGTSILRTPYSLLVSVIVGLTNLIPVFGPWIGSAISAFLLLMINPMQALWFIVFIIVLQQLENNLIYPKVVGSSIGLSGLWVIVAILVCGGLFGVAGMFLGIPLFAVISRMFGRFVDERIIHRFAEATEEDDADTQEVPENEASSDDELMQNAVQLDNPDSHTDRDRKAAKRRNKKRKHS